MKIIFFHRPCAAKSLCVLMAALAILLFSSCKDDDCCSMPGEFDSGIFIVNEGPFQNGTGTITFWNRETGEVKHQIFEAANAGEQLGNIVQSMSIYEGKAYIPVNNGGKVVVADAATFDKTGEITGLNFPAYFLGVSNDKGYVSQWGQGNGNGGIIVVNLKNLNIEDTITTGTGADWMLKAGNMVYVANSGGFSRDSTIAVIDVSSGTVTKKIVVGDNPAAIQKDKNGAIWVIGRGYTDFVNPSNSKPGKLIKIENDQVAFSLDLPNGGSDLVINDDGDRLFFLDGAYGGNINQFKILDAAQEAELFVSGFFYALGYDSEDDRLLATDAKDFSSNGEVKVFDMTGHEIQIIAAGIVPGGFWVE